MLNVEELNTVFLEVLVCFIFETAESCQGKRIVVLLA